MNERDYSSQIEDLLRLGGWRYCHFRPARTLYGWRTALSGHPGLTDYICVRASTRQVLYIEIKGDSGRLTQDEKDWIADLRAAGETVFVWYPRDFEVAQDVLLGEGCGDLQVPEGQGVLKATRDRL